MSYRAKSRPAHERIIAVAGGLAVEGLVLLTLMYHPSSPLTRFDAGGGIAVTLLAQGRDTGAPPIQPKPRSLAEMLLDDVRQRMAATYVSLPLDKGRAPPRSLSEFFGQSDG